MATTSTYSPEKDIQKFLDLQKDIKDILKDIQKNSAKSKEDEEKKKKEDEEKEIKGIKGNKWVASIASALEAVGRVIDHTTEAMNMLEEAVYPLNATLGMNREQQIKFTVAMGNTSVETLKYGKSIKDLAEIQKGYMNEIGRNTLLSNNAMQQMARMAKILGSNDAATKFAGDMDKVGMSTSNSYRLFEKLSIEARKVGIDSNKAAAMVQENIAKAQTYGFKNGINGLTQMVNKSLQMRMNMEQVFSFTEKNRNIEGAIMSGAATQVLGGAFSSFADPLKNLYNSLNDQNAQQERLINLGKDVMYFNKELGMADYKSTQDREGARQFAEANGLNFQEMTQAWSRNANIAQMEDEGLLNGRSDRAQELIKNLASFNDNKWTISALNKNTGIYEDMDVRSLTNDQIEQLVTKESDLNGIARSMLSANEKYQAQMLMMKTQLGVFTEKRFAKTIHDNLDRLMDFTAAHPQISVAVSLLNSILGGIGKILMAIIFSGLGRMIGGRIPSTGGVGSVRGGGGGGKPPMSLNDAKANVRGFNNIDKNEARYARQRFAFDAMKQNPRYARLEGDAYKNQLNKFMKMDASQANRYLTRATMGRNFSVAAKGFGAIGGGILAAGAVGYNHYQQGNFSDPTKVGTAVGSTGGAGLGAWGGAAAGAALGSVIPGIGTAIGGIIGGIVGAIGGEKVGAWIGGAFNAKASEGFNKTLEKRREAEDKEMNEKRKEREEQNEKLAKIQKDLDKYSDKLSKDLNKSLDKEEKRINKQIDEQSKLDKEYINKQRKANTDYFKNLKKISNIKSPTETWANSDGGWENYTKPFTSVGDMIKTPQGNLVTDPADILMAAKPGGILSGIMANDRIGNGVKSISMDPITINGQLSLNGNGNNVDLSSVLKDRTFILNLTNMLQLEINSRLAQGGNGGKNISPFVK